MKEITLEMQVKVPSRTSAKRVQEAINKALDEPPCFWNDWTVGAATVTGVSEEFEDEAA